MSAASEVTSGGVSHSPAIPPMAPGVTPTEGSGPETKGMASSRSVAARIACASPCTR